MIWREDNEHLIKKLETIISKSNNDRVSLHIFVPKDSTSIPRDQPWIVTHESLTKEEDAAKVGLIVYILQKYDKLSTTKNEKTRTRRSSPTDTIYLVQNENEDFGELVNLLQNRRSENGVKLLLVNSLGSATTFPEDARCKHCNGVIQTALEDLEGSSSSPRNSSDFKSGYENYLANARLSNQIRSSESESNHCFLCGKQQNRSTAKDDDVNVKFSRHFNDKERQIHESHGNSSKLQNGVIADAVREKFSINEKNTVRGLVPGFSTRSSCLCFRGSLGSEHEVNECRSCRKMLQRYGFDGLPKRGERSRSSEEYKAGKNCHCSDEGMFICLSCLLDKLERPELKQLGRSESAPCIFFHGDFKNGRGTLKGVKTFEKGTSTDEDAQKFNRVTSIEKSTEVRILTFEKATNTPIEKSNNTMNEKATNTDDLQEESVIETAVKETVETVSSLDLSADSKKSLLFSCIFCSNKAYRSKHLLDVHMKNNHKKCNCPCQLYFRTREDYLAHFYFVYPLPCMVDKKCPERFRSLYYQSLHHKEAHYAAKPFFCIPCYRSNGDAALTRTAFKDIASLRIHATSHGHDTRDMFLVSIDETPDDSKLPFSMRCSGINYC